jgi:hypothetical protein
MHALNTRANVKRPHGGGCISHFWTVMRPIGGMPAAYNTG